jgi:signal transduction histidine kinase
MNIIRSAVFQLTIWYLAIIMALSIGFSLVLYRVSDIELNRGLRRQQDIFLNQAVPVPRLPGFDEFRQTQMLESRGHLQANLLLFNLVVLLLGGAASYFLARRTLRPIAEAMEAQSRFTADASHELRTPLTAMQTEIEVVLRDPLLTKEIAEGLLKSNLEEVAKLKALSDGLLRLTREDGQRDTWETLDIKTIADEAIGRTLSLATAKEITIENHIGNLEVQGDRVSLVELLVILIDNAIKYSDAKTTVKLTSHQRGQTVTIAVIDQGHGIKASDLPHIFDRFYRADPSRSKERTNGYGLGLSIAKKIVDVHGGTIDAKSVLDKGSTFFVRLPLASNN